jgi:hypothetical protein
MCGSVEKCISYFAKQQTEGIYQLGDVVVDGRIVFRLISCKCVPVHTVSGWRTVMDR